MVGDGNQSMYGFRGSRPDFLFNIQSEMPNVRIINMDINYRSGEKIIEVANRILDNMDHKAVNITGTGKESFVSFKRFDSISDEVTYVVKQVKELLNAGTNPEEIAIIYRTNACAGVYEMAFVVEKIKYYCKTGDSFFGTKVLKDIIAYLKAACFYDVSSMSRILNIPNRYLGKKFKEKWEQYINSKISPFDALLKHYEHEYWERNAADLAYHLDTIKKNEFNPEKAIQYISEIVGYKAWLESQSESDGLISKAQEDLINEATYIAGKYPNITKFLESARDMGSKKSKDGAVMLTTIHGSKGLEFDYVFFVSLIDRLIPHVYSEDSEEERRMFFVGTTRARKHLYMSSYDHGFLGNTKRTNIKINEVSRFVLECKDII